MRGIDKHLYMYADMSGLLGFVSRSDAVTVRTAFADLRPVPCETAHSGREGCVMKLDARTLSRVLMCSVSQPHSLVLAMAGTALVLYAQLPEDAGSLTYYVPMLELVRRRPLCDAHHAPENPNATTLVAGSLTRSRIRALARRQTRRQDDDERADPALRFAPAEPAAGAAAEAADGGEEGEPYGEDGGR